MTIRKFESHYPEIHKTAYIDDTALVSGEVEIGEESSVWPMTVIRGDVNFIKIGKRTNIQDGSVLHVTHAPNEHSEKIGAAQTAYALIIGDDVTIGHKALLHACEIQNRVLVGMGAIVMDGTVVEEETMIAAGSVVPPRKTLESGYLWVGNPARKVRELTDKEKKYLSYSAEHYVRLKERTENNEWADSIDEDTHINR
ncbi:MAG: gamma carbonic anhydrase family protein [Cocleimonas sp.]